MKRARIATYLANFFDHFDTAIYGFLVPIIAPMFFPKSDPTVALIQGYGVVIVGLITRPLGAWYYSKKAQRDGPQSAFINTIQGMTLTTLAFVLVNPYSDWGAYGALSLCLLRGMQNFFGAGENSIAGLYVLENAEPNQQHPISCLYLGTQMGGILLAGAIANLLFYAKEPQLYWKWPFFVAFITGICCWWLRRQPGINWIRLPNTKVKYNWRGILRVIPMAGLYYLTYSVSFVFFNSFANILTGIDIAKLMTANTAFMFYDLILLILLGQMLRNIKCVPILRTTSIALIILTPLLFSLMPSAQFVGLCVIRIILVTLGVIFCIPLHRWYLEQFSKENRYITTAIGTAIGTELIGRSFPAVGLALWHFSHMSIVPGLYIALIGILALLALSVDRPDINIE